MWLFWYQANCYKIKWSTQLIFLYWSVLLIWNLNVWSQADQWVLNWWHLHQILQEEGSTGEFVQNVRFLHEIHGSHRPWKVGRLLEFWNLGFCPCFQVEKSLHCSIPWVPEATRLLNPAGQTSVRSEVSEGPNASSLWWRTPTVSLWCPHVITGH